MSDLLEQYQAEMVKLDAVVEVLGIADSHEDPADCIKSWIVRTEAAEARCARLEQALQVIACNALSAHAVGEIARAALQQETGDELNWDRAMKESEACAPIPPEEMEPSDG